MAFTNPFFSSAGQSERLKNVGSVLNIAFNPFRKDQETKIVSTVKGTTGKVLETIANHPYITAGAAATLLSPKGALAAAKVGYTKLIAPLSTKTKVIGAIAAVPTVSILKTSKKARNLVSESITKAPSSLATFGENVGKFIENPSGENLKNIITETPLVAAGVVGVGLISVIPAATGLISGALTRKELAEQTKALERQAKAAEEAAKIAAGKGKAPDTNKISQDPTSPIITGSSPIVADSTSPLAQQTKEIEKIGKRSVAKKAKKRRKAYKEVPLRNTIRILNVNSNRAG